MATTTIRMVPDTSLIGFPTTTVLMFSNTTLLIFPKSTPHMLIKGAKQVMIYPLMIDYRQTMDCIAESIHHSLNILGNKRLGEEWEKSVRAKPPRNTQDLFRLIEKHWFDLFIPIEPHETQDTSTKSAVPPNTLNDLNYFSTFIDVWVRSENGLGAVTKGDMAVFIERIKPLVLGLLEDAGMKERKAYVEEWLHYMKKRCS
ncbi:hypothetical protein HK102_012765 [Quaeritorhiza haematococci]|nr:hypothetical protein HK102_012765 [Quaeritorhiza haematococci]